ncbi:MAG: hypothetical protein ACRDJC_16865, partial [Thermomicrobiales bacterium]
DLYDVRAGALTPLYGEDDATRESRIALFTGTTDSFSSTTNGAFATGGDGDRGEREREQEQEQEQPAESAPPTPTSVIAIEGESAPPAAAATPPVIAIENGNEDGENQNQNQEQNQNQNENQNQDPNREQAQEAAQVFMTSALYAFPGESEADAWINAQRERLLTGTSGTITEVPDAPTLGDASATFST